MLQQEEAQRDMIHGHKSEECDVTAMYIKAPPAKIYQCTLCRGKGHTNDRCWSVIGYPKWHPNYKGPVTTSPVSNSGMDYRIIDSGASDHMTPHLVICKLLILSTLQHGSIFQQEQLPISLIRVLSISLAPYH